MQTEYEDEDGNKYVLRHVDIPYHKENHACAGCAFKFGGSKACNNAPTCTPIDGVITSTYRWIQVYEEA